jgi:hypothetical protein
MSKRYVSQPYRLRLQTATDLTSAPVVQIKYKKPVSGTEGTFSGTVASATKIYHDLTGTENDEAGVWRFQTDAQYLANGEYYPGETWFQTVHARFT